MTMEEIVEAMRAKTFSVLDEIRAPHMRWTFLREHPLLMQIVRQIRDEQASGVENTQSTFVTSGRTITSSVTERIVEESELTPDPSSGDNSSMKSISATEKNVANISGSKSFGVLTDHKVQQQLQQQTSQWKYLVYAAGGVALTLAVIFWKMQGGAGMSSARAAELGQFAQQQANRGEYDVALRAISEIELARGLTSEDRIFKTKLLLASDNGNPIELTRSIESLASVDPQILPMSLDVFMGLSASRLNNYSQAITHLNSAYAQKPVTENSMLNLSAAYYMSKNLAKAFQILDRDRVREHLPYYQVLKGLIALRWPDGPGLQQILESAYNDIKDFHRGFGPRTDDLRSRGSGNEAMANAAAASLNAIPDEKLQQDTLKAGNVLDYGRELRFERMLIRAMLAYRLKEMDNYRKDLMALVQTNPLETKKYMASPFLDWQILDWSRGLRSHCENYFKSQPDDALARGAWALCLAAAGDLIGARNVSDLARRQYAGNGYIVGIDSLMLLTQGREQEASGAVKMYAVTHQLLIHWVRAETCEKMRDWVCSEQAWRSYAQIDAAEPRAFLGMAVAASNLTREADVNSNLVTAARFGPRYTPIFAMRAPSDKF